MQTYTKKTKRDSNCGIWPMLRAKSEHSDGNERGQPAKAPAAGLGKGRTCGEVPARHGPPAMSRG